MQIENPTRWGVKGHYLVHKEACEALPETMPDFFRQSEDRLVSLASQPDRWKSDSLNYLVGATRPDHYLAYELIKDKPLAPDRFAAIVAADKQGLKPVQVGLLPYRVAELYQNLTADFALWRNEIGQRGNTPLAQELQESAIYDAGIVGHYVGDASQPLHSTIHVDGWRPEVPNPNGYRTTRGLHREFETQMLNHASIDPHEVQQKMAPPQPLLGDPMQWAVGLIQESNSQVEHLYQLEKTGDLKPDQPTPQGIEFAEERIAKGASNLRDLWVSAWTASEALAQEMAKDKPS